jgi:hypothetical protein
MMSRTADSVRGTGSAASSSIGKSVHVTASLGMMWTILIAPPLSAQARTFGDTHDLAGDRRSRPRQ